MKPALWYSQSHLVKSFIQEVEWGYFIFSLNHVLESTSMTSDISFDEGEALLDWVVIRQIWWKVDEFDASENDIQSLERT